MSTDKLTVDSFDLSQSIRFEEDKQEQSLFSFASPIVATSTQVAIQESHYVPEIERVIQTQVNGGAFSKFDFLKKFQEGMARLDSRNYTQTINNLDTVDDRRELLEQHPTQSPAKESILDMLNLMGDQMEDFQQTKLDRVRIKKG